MEYSIAQKAINLVLRVIGKLKARKAPCILCYHSISNDKWNFSLAPKSFERQIRLLSQTRKIVSLKEILSTDGTSLIDKIAITFDDGYQDIYKNALPILKKYAIPAAVFVIGDSKLVNRMQLGNNKKLLGDDQIKRLKKKGWEIGFHSKTHRNLNNLSEDNLKDEIIQGKKDLEKRLGFKINYFAYPNGFYSAKIINAVRKAGFKAAFTVDGGRVIKSDFPYKVDRVTVSKYIPLKNFVSLISDLGLIFNRFFTQALKVKDNLFYKLSYLV